MTMKRRRFLQIAAICPLVLTGSAHAKTQRYVWKGRGFGADLEIAIFAAVADKDRVNNALNAARDVIRRAEGLFSLFDPRSSLSILNDTGTLRMPPEFMRLIAKVDTLHGVTDGLFDPTDQARFRALQNLSKNASTETLDAVLVQTEQLLGWGKVNINGSIITLPHPDMALTLNGVAQGFVTDRVSETLQRSGFKASLVNIGEFRASGGRDFTLGLPITAERMETLRIKNASIATSASDGFKPLPGQSHILHPQNDNLPGWAQVTVESDDATTADAISTALILTKETDLARHLVDNGVIRSAYFVRNDRSLVRIKPS